MAGYVSATSTPLLGPAAPTHARETARDSYLLFRYIPGLEYGLENRSLYRRWRLQTDGHGEGPRRS